MPKGGSRPFNSSSKSAPHSKHRDLVGDLVCHYCLKKGHIQPDCRQRAKDRANGNFKSVKPPSTQFAGDSSSSGHLQLFAVSVLSTSLDYDFPNTWYLDSGATRHMT